MGSWDQTVTRTVGGRFQIVITRIGASNLFSSQEGVPTDVSYFRGTPTIIANYGSGDPFGDATLVLRFPSITGFDDFDSPEIGSWLGDASNVDIYWIPGETVSALPLLPAGIEQLRYENPTTGQADVYAPVNSYSLVGSEIVPTGVRGTAVFEGFIASLEFDEQGELGVQCQGALFQGDHYLEKPFYPAAPQTLESLIANVFNHAQRPHLRTQPLEIAWPAGWTKVAPAITGPANAYTPNVLPGDKWTGFTTRQTGGWERSLTGYIQSQISQMLTTDDSGVTPGNQWTVAHVRRGENGSSGRTPQLTVRDRFRTPDFSVWYGSPGVKCTLTKDGTQAANIYYGSGTDIAGTVWRNAVIAPDGSRTDYQPLAADAEIWPPTNNPLFNKAIFASEAYLQFGTGFNQPDAVITSQKLMQRTLRPSWAGTITLATDPSSMLPRWLIKAGMTVRLQGFQGSGIKGMNFHIASVEADPEAGTVTLTVDTQYRDLLTVAQAIARTRDPLTPSKLLQINRASAVIEDIQAPWDYSAGSGYVPLASKDFYAYIPTGQAFPYSQWSATHPPLIHPDWYVACNADAATRDGRWAGPVPILTSEKGHIARAEFYMVNINGIIIKQAFHVSLYYVNVHVGDMPYNSDGLGHSPFIPGAFESIDPATGNPWADANFLAPPQSYIIGWGNAAQPAGFSPGLFTGGAHPTGLLADDGGFDFDNSNTANQANYVTIAAPGTEEASAITIYAMFYCDHTEPVYFQGRLIRQPQGA